jgi:hypothetical protein
MPGETIATSVVELAVSLVMEMALMAEF